MSSNILIDDEIIVYDFVKEYLKKKQLFNFEEIVEFLKYRLKYNLNFNENKIVIIIKSLINKKLIIPGTILSKEDILEVPKRVEIYDYITAMPGANINEIMTFHGISSHHAIWHLRLLEKFDFIRFVRFKNQKTFFKSDFDTKYDEIFFYLRNVKVKMIIKLLKDQQSSINTSKISESLKIHYSTLQKYVHILKKFNLLMELDEESKKQYLLNPEMLKVIQNVIDKLK